MDPGAEQWLISPEHPTFREKYIVLKIWTTNKKGGVFQDRIHFKNDSSKLSILHCTIRNISVSCGHWESRDPLSENPFGVRVSTLWRYLSPQLLCFHILFEQCTLCFGLCILDGYWCFIHGPLSESQSNELKTGDNTQCLTLDRVKYTVWTSDKSYGKII